MARKYEKPKDIEYLQDFALVIEVTCVRNTILESWHVAWIPLHNLKIPRHFANNLGFGANM